MFTITINGAVPGPTAKNDYAWVNEGGTVSAADGQTSNGATGGMTNANSSKTFSDFSGGMERFDFNNDGSKLYVNDYSSGDYKQYSLSTPFDVSTATADSSGATVDLDAATSYYNIIFNGTGSKAFILNYNSDYIREYDLATSYDITDASYNSQYYIASYDTTPTDFEFSSDGSKLFLLGSTDDKIIQLNLSTPYSISTASDGGSFSIGDYVTSTSLWGMTLSPDGKKLFVADTNENVHEFFLSVENDVTTASFLGYTSVSSSIGSIGGIAFNNDGTKFYASDRNSDKIVEYNTSVPFSVQSFMPGGNTGDVLHTTRTASQDTGTNLSVNGFRVGGVEGQGTFSHSNGGSLEGEYGTLTMQLTGAYSYAANSDIAGLDAGEVVYDEFNYKVQDSNGNNDTAVLTITIVGQDDSNQPPTISTAAVDPTVNEAVDASSQVLSGSGTIVFADDTDSSLTITAQTSSTVSASSGVTLSNTLQNALAAAVTLTDNGDNTASWTLNADGLDLDFLAVGDSITIENVVTATDDDGETVTDTITVTINGTNDAPSGSNNTVTTIEDNNHVFQASEFGFNDPDTGDALSRITVENLPTDGVLRFTNDGTNWQDVSAGGNFTKAMIDAGWLRFEPASNENGSPYASFNFKVHDGDEASAYVAIMTINVAAWADAPTANDDTISATSGTVATGTVLTNDSDPDGTTPTVSAIETGSSVGGGTSGTIGSALPGTYGSLTLNEDGTYTYSVDADNADVLALGDSDDPLTETFTYTITDGTALGGTDTATITVNVYGINDAPIVTAQTSVNGTVTEFPNGDPNEDTGTHTITGSFDIADSDSSSFTLSYETSVQWASEISTHNSTQPVGTFTLSDQTVDGTGSIEWTYSIADYLIADKVTANGEVSYLSLDSGESFAETFTVTIDDGEGETVTQDVVITVNGANDFDAQDDFAVVAEGGSISVGNDAGQSVGNPITDASSTFDAAFGGDGSVAVEALAFNNDGSKLYLLENNSGRIQQHTLSTQFDVSTASAEYTIYDGVNWSRDLVFNADGTKAFTINPSTDIVYEYTLSTAFDIGTMELAFQKAVSDGQGTNVRPKALDFSSDGTKLFYIDQEGQQIIQENLGTAYDTSTASLAAILDISEIHGIANNWGEGFVVSPDGRKMFAMSEGNRIYEWILHTPNDITTATFIHDRDLSSFGYNLRGLAFSNDGSKLFFANKSSGTTEDVVTFNTSVPFSTFYDEPSHSGDVINTNRDETRDTGGNLDVVSIRTGATKGAGTPGTLGTPARHLWLPDHACEWELYLSGQ